MNGGLVPLVACSRAETMNTKQIFPLGWSYFTHFTRHSSYNRDAIEIDADVAMFKRKHQLQDYMGIRLSITSVLRFFFFNKTNDDVYAEVQDITKSGSTIYYSSGVSAQSLVCEEPASPQGSTPPLYTATTTGPNSPVIHRNRSSRYIYIILID